MRSNREILGQNMDTKFDADMNLVYDLKNMYFISISKFTIPFSISKNLFSSTLTVEIKQSLVIGTKLWRSIHKFSSRINK